MSSQASAQPSPASISQGPIPLTAKERDWQSANPVVTLVPDEGNPPMNFRHPDGTFANLSINYMNLIVKKSCTFIWFRFSAWNESLCLAVAGEVDGVMPASIQVDRKPYVNLFPCLAQRPAPQGVRFFTRPTSRRPSVLDGPHGKAEAQPMSWFTCSSAFLVLLMLLCPISGHEVSLATAGTEHAADGSFRLTDAEKSWIAQHPVVRIQMSDRYPPFEFRENDRYQGMGYDYLSVISKRLGIEFQITGLTWSQALEAIQEKRDVDLLLAVTRSPEREEIVELTRAYLTFPQVIITRKQGQFVAAVQDLAGSTVAVEKDYVMVAWLRRDIPTAKLVLTEDTATALEAVATGEADAYVGNLAAASYLIEKKGLVDLKVAAPTDYGDDALAMGVRKDWPELARLIDKALGSMTEKEHRTIRQKWLRCECGWRTLDVLKWILIVVGVALVFIVQLRAMVKRRTAELRGEVELRRKKEEALRESEERFHKIFDSVNDAIFIQDIETGAILDVNQRMCELYGYTREEAKRLDIGKLSSGFSPYTQKDALNWIKKATEGTPQLFEWMAKRKGGDTFWVEVNMRMAAIGEQKRQLVTVRDITERKRSETELRESEERYRRLVQLSSEGVWRVECVPPVPVSLGEHEQAKLILERARGAECNDALVRQFGYARAEEVLGRPLTDFMAGTPEERLAVVIQFIRSGYRVTDWEARKQTQDGRTLWTLGNAVGVVEDGTLKFVWGTQRDITERKGAEEALAERTRQLEAVRVVGEEITREMHLPALLELIVERAVRLVGAAGGSVMLWDESRSVLVPGVWVGRAPDSRDASKIALEEGVSGIVAEQRKGMIVNDYRNSPLARPVMSERTKITAVIAEPLLYQDRLVGVIHLDNAETDRRFTEQDQEILRLFAAQAAIAIENARLYEATQRELAERRQAEERLRVRTRQLEAIRAISEEIARELDLTILLDLIHRRAAELVGAHRGAVSLWDEGSQILVQRAWHGYGTWLGEVHPRLGQGVVGLVAQRREGMIVNDYRTSPYANPVFLERTDDAAVLCEPLLYRDRLLGVIILAKSTSEGLFTNEDQHLLRLFAAHAAIAIENARLYEATQRELADRVRAEEALRRSAERLRALHEMDQAILAEQSPEAIAQAAMRFIRRQVPCQRASFTVYDFEGAGVTVLATQVNDETNSEPGIRLPLEEVWIPPELQRGEAYMVEDVPNLPHPRPIDRRLHAEGIRSYISAPLIAQGKLLGSLNLAATSPGAFAAEHLQIAREVADQIAIALLQAQLFRSVSQHHEQLRALTARLAEVEESERRRLARELHDRVGQSLTALGINLNILRGQFSPGAAGKSTDRLEDSLRLVEDTMGSIRNVMTDLRPPVLDDYGLVATLRWYGTQFSTRAGVPALVEGEELTPRLPQDVETALFRIAQEALTNVSKHARATQVRITLETGADNVRLTIADDGVGFDPALLREHGEGSKWGLINIRERAEAFGGTLQVDTAPGKGTRISVQVGR